MLVKSSIIALPSAYLAVDMILPAGQAHPHHTAGAGLYLPLVTVAPMRLIADSAFFRIGHAPSPKSQAIASFLLAFGFIYTGSP